MLLSLITALLNAKIENMVAARNTEGDMPVTKVYDQIMNIEIAAIITLPPFLFSKGFNKKSSSIYKIPTCKPETANTCMAPAEA